MKFGWPFANLDPDTHFRDHASPPSFELMKAVPDLQIEVKRQYVSEDAVLVEVIIRGTHLGGWRGLFPTLPGKRISIDSLTAHAPGDCE
jgi:hypothetical protein